MKRWFFFIFLSGICQASSLPPETQITMIDDVSGGLFTNYSGDKILSSFSPNLKNVFIDNGRIESINGFITVGSSRTLVRVDGIFPFFQESGDTRFIVTDSSIVLDTADFNSWVFVSSGLNTGVLTRCIQVRNKMWCSNGSDAVFTWDGTNKVNLNGIGTTPNVPKFKYMAYWQNRVFGLNTTGDGSSLDFSAIASTDGVKIAPDDSRAWPTTNNLSVGRGDGQIGTALWVKDGQLRVGKERSIYTIYGIS